MTSFALVTGALFRKPETRTSKGGKPFVTGTIRDNGGEGNASRYFKFVAFDAAPIAELSRLSDGDAVAVQGSLAVEEFGAKDGVRKFALKIVADHVVALRQPPKKREPKAAADVASKSWQRPFDDWGDGR